MKDPGMDVMQAASKAGIPCWRSAWQATERHMHPPSVYAVFNAQVAQGRSQDDSIQTERQWIYLNIYGEGDVWATAESIQAEMLLQEWLLQSRQDVYDSQAGKAMQALSFYREVELFG